MAKYYVLEIGSLPLFLPFLPEDVQQEARQGKLRVVGAAEGDTAIGAAAFDLTGETAQLVYIALSPAYQQKHIGTGMLWYFASVMGRLGCRNLSVSVSADHPAEAALSAIMETMGARLELGSEQVTCPISALRSSPMLRTLLGKQSSRAVAMEYVSAIDLRELDAQMLQEGASSEPMDWERFDPKLSFFGMDAHHKLNCCVCAVREGDGISVEWIYTTHSGAKTLIMAVLELLQVCEAELPPDAEFSAVLVNDSARKLLEHLVGDAVETRIAFRWVLRL